MKKSDINMKQDPEMMEFAKPRDYETEWDHAYRVRNVPSRFLDTSVLAMLMIWGEEQIFSMIKYIREQDLKELACNAIGEYSQKETTTVSDLRFYAIRGGKKYKNLGCRVCVDTEHWLSLHLRSRDN